MQRLCPKILANGGLGTRKSSGSRDVLPMAAPISVRWDMPLWGSPRLWPCQDNRHFPFFLRWYRATQLCHCVGWFRKIRMGLSLEMDAPCQCRWIRVPFYSPRWPVEMLSFPPVFLCPQIGGNMSLQFNICGQHLGLTVKCVCVCEPRNRQIMFLS